jgi:pyruvate,water dikinase
MKKTAQPANKYILWFKEINKDDIPLVGGKGANLGEMASFEMPIPQGFVLTAKAYFDFLEENHLIPKIKAILAQIVIDDPTSFFEASQKIKKLILVGRITPDISRPIIDSYLKLGGTFRQAWVAIRSSATAEDLPTASFAGQQASFLNIRGEANVIQKVKECWASLFEPRAIFYRQEKGFPHLKVGLAVVIQEMVPADISGVMFTCDPVTEQKNRLVIEAVWGLGEYIVQGKVTPDFYLLDKGSLEILTREVSKQTVELVKFNDQTKQSFVPKNRQLKRKLTDAQIKKLAQIGKKIHQHYFHPQDIEWTFFKNKFYIVQTRPVTTLSKKSKGKAESIKIKRKPILSGQGASPGIVSGPVRLIFSAKEINKIQPGEVLVTPMTNPDFVPAMKKVVAIVTDKGGQTSHAAIVSRELGVACVVGTEKATTDLSNGQFITVNGTQGEVYQGGLLEKKDRLGYLETKKVFSSEVPSTALKTATKIYVNLGDPKVVKEVAQRNVDGVGLLRAEFMMAQIGIHPQKILKDKKQKIFINQLADNIGLFCQEFYPRPVVYRASDFKTNEYRHLKGGEAYEKKEENPFIGFRGAFRYLASPEVFEMELKAIQKVREKSSNLWLMIPFCRTPDELRETKKIITAAGLMRSSTFKLWLMAEIPSNVILLEEFIKIGIDGVSIGSNDLTMLILGIDRDNAQLAPTFKENQPAVLWAIEKIIRTCLKNNLTCSICGQAPSVYPDLVEKLVCWGITSISVNPDVIEEIRELVYKIEKK